MGDIEALRGVWNIVPTPFLPDGALDTASIPTLVDVRAGDRRRRPDDPRRARRGRAARRRGAHHGAAARPSMPPAGSIPVCVGVSHASTDRADRLRPRGRGGRRPLGDARSPAARPADRRRAASPLPRRRLGDLDPRRRPGPPGVLGRPDERRLPARARRRGPVVPRDQARGGADAAQGRPPGRRLARRHRARRPRRGDADRGAAPRQPRDDDRVRVPGDPGGRRPALVRGRPRRRRGAVRPLRDGDPVREPGAPQPADPQARLPAARRDRPRDGPCPGHAARRRAPSPTSTTSSAAPGLDQHLEPGGCLPGDD